MTTLAAIIDSEALNQYLMVGGMIASAVWAVSKIKNASDRTTTALEGLSQSIDRLNNNQEHQSKLLNRHEIRLTVLETLHRVANNPTALAQERLDEQNRGDDEVPIAQGRDS